MKPAGPKLPGIDDLPLLATPRQAAEIMGPSECQVRQLIRDGKLEHVAIGKRVMIPRDAIEQFIACNRVRVAPCRVETPDHASTGTASAQAGTSPGPSPAAAVGSAQRALKIAGKLSSPSPTSSTPETEGAGRVIPLRCS